jgi:L-amino acid N-acyltransferase YncA
VVTIVRYHKSLEDQVMKFFREGYPNSFDGNDLRSIKKSLKMKPDNTFLVVFNEEGEIMGCLTGINKWDGFHALYVGKYLYVGEKFRYRGIAKIIGAIAEEVLKDKARLLVVMNAGILPESDQSVSAFKKAGFVVFGQILSLFRDDIPVVVLGLRNPYWPIGRGIPKNSGWDPSMRYTLSGSYISEKDYNAILNNPGLAPIDKWGLNLLSKEDILMINI